MRAGTELDVFLPVLHPVQYCNIGGNAEIAGDIEHPELASGVCELAFQIADVGIVKLVEIHFRHSEPVVPPDCVGIALYQFEEALHNSFLARIACCAAVGIRGVRVGAPVEKIQSTGRKISETVVAQRPDRRPFKLGRLIKPGRIQRNFVGVAAGRVLIRFRLRVAKQQDLVGKDGIAGREIAEPPQHPDLVALINAGIALDRLHQRAGFALLGSAALAEAATAQCRPEFVDILGWRREIMRCIETGIHRQMGFHPLKPGDHASQRAHMLPESVNCGPRRDAAVSTAGHHQLGAGAKFDRRRGAPRISQLLAATGRTLRAVRHVVLRHRRAQQIKTDNVIAQFGAKASCDGFGDFHGGKLYAALSEGIASQR